MGEPSYDNEKKSILEVRLHPLIVLNVSDHWTRASVVRDEAEKVVGVLLGVQTGRAIEVHTSFELVVKQERDGPVIDTAYLEDKKNHYSQVFPTYDIVGWYTTGKGLSDIDTIFHKTIMRYNESPLLLLMDTQPPSNVSSLPVHFYETVVTVKNDTPKYSFCKVPYVIESEESERISIDNVAHGTGSSSIATPVKMYRDALMMLQDRVRVVIQYLNNVKGGQHPVNQSVLREVSSLCHMLPSYTSVAYQAQYSADYSESLLITYLSMMTRACNNLAMLTEKHELAFERKATGRRPWY